MFKKISIILLFTITIILLYNMINRRDVSMEKKEKHTIEVKNNGTFIDGVLIVNKTYSINRDYKPDSYEKLTDSCPKCLDKTTYNAFLIMQKDAASSGLKIWIQSGYRSYEYQERLYNNYVKKDGIKKADTYSSRPGHSEHQTGLSFDLNTIDDNFANTEEGKWINDNAYKYGFIVRFPKYKEKYTGYKYEPWHLRYVGKELSEILYNGGDWISLEEYFGIKSSYKE